MRAIVAALVLVFGWIHQYAAAAQQGVTLSRPTILILVDTRAEQKRHGEDPEYNEAAGDFAVYSSRMAEALKDHRGFRIQWSSAQSIRFPGTRFEPVLRRKLGGWGYVFYRPGREPIVIEGVAVDDELVCTAVRLFETKVEGYACGE
jgi:hypothetical protein